MISGRSRTGVITYRHGSIAPVPAAGVSLPAGRAISALWSSGVERGQPASAFAGVAPFSSFRSHQSGLATRCAPVGGVRRVRSEPMQTAGHRESLLAFCSRSSRISAISDGDMDLWPMHNLAFCVRLTSSPQIWRR
jgi:hypothetical protein